MPLRQRGHRAQATYEPTRSEAYALKPCMCGSLELEALKQRGLGGDIPAEALNVCERDALKQARNAGQYVHPLTQTHTSQKRD